MAVDGLINTSAEFLPELVKDLGQIAIWLQAFGIILILWMIFNIVSFIMNIKKKKILKNIRNDLKRLEKKIDKLSKK